MYIIYHVWKISTPVEIGTADRSFFTASRPVHSSCRVGWRRSRNPPLRRPRALNAKWNLQGICMKRALALVGIVFGLALCSSTPGLAQYLTGSAREDFIRSTTRSCMQAKPNSKETRDIPDSLFEGNCRCYANTLAEKITVADMRSGNRTMTDPITKAASAACSWACETT